MDGATQVTVGDILVTDGDIIHLTTAAAGVAAATILAIHRIQFILATDEIIPTVKEDRLIQI